jgi:V-type H+-transporting ATPase subunit C
MYWLVSLPLTDEPADRVWNRLQELTTYNNEYSINFKFNVPDSFRVGTLDSLLALSDDLIKVNSAMEGTVNKIRRQLYELQSHVPEDDRSDIWVEGMTPEAYLQRFAWNEAKYPSRRLLRETVAAVSETVQKLEDDLKVKASEYNQLRTTLQAAARKSAGSLAVRDLSELMRPEHVVETDNLTTLLVVVPKTSWVEWLESYETLADYVVREALGWWSPPRCSFFLSVFLSCFFFGIPRCDDDGCSVPRYGCQKP